jgi:tripartite-type tricarboxylate transporter receptor subunit TctC
VANRATRREPDATKEKKMSRTVTAPMLLAVALGSTAPAVLAAENYPSRPLRFIVPFPPGGANDIVARLVGPKLTEKLGQQVVVDNRPGASGSIALEITARALPDGHTLLVGNNTSNGIVPVLYAERMKADPRKEITGISLLAAIPHVVIALTKLPPNTFDELIAYAKARPGQLNYTAPLGGHPHLDMLALISATGIKMVHLPSKGAGETIPSLLRGESHVSNSNVASVIGLIRSGQLKAYAVTSEARIAELPNVPTFAEVGLKGVGSINWVGLFAPANTPRAAINKLHATIVDVLSEPGLKETYAKRLVPLAVSASPAEFNAFVQSEMKRWVKVVQDNNVRLE